VDRADGLAAAKTIALTKQLQEDRPSPGVTPPRR